MEFYLTQMGKKFYTRDVPDIAKALNRIADSLEALAQASAPKDPVAEPTAVPKPERSADVIT